MESLSWNLVRLSHIIHNVDPRGDLSLTNLQDVMEDDLYASPSGYSSTNGMAPGLGNSLMTKSSLFPSYSTSYQRGLGLNSNPNFVLSSYDDDFNHPCMTILVSSKHIDGSLTPQASRNSFTPMQSMYMDSSNMMNDYVSESSYSPRPRLTPLASSPRYAETDLSPRRSFAQSTSQSRLMGTYSSILFLNSRNDEPRLQRSLSAMAPTSLNVPGPEMAYPTNSFKRKDSYLYDCAVMFRMKPSSWQNNDIDSYRGHIKDMSHDHNGCRALQQCLDECPDRVINMIYDEVGNELTELMMDSFGNYLFQKLLDVSSVEQRYNVVGDSEWFICIVTTCEASIS